VEPSRRVIAYAVSMVVDAAAMKSNDSRSEEVFIVCICSFVQKRIGGCLLMCCILMFFNVK